MIIYFHIYLLFITVLLFLNSESAETSSIRTRAEKNDLLPFRGSKTDLSKRDGNSLKIISNEPFIIQLATTNSSLEKRKKVSDRERKETADKRKAKVVKKRLPKLKGLRKRHRTRRDAHATAAKGLKAFTHKPSNKLEEKPEALTDELPTTKVSESAARLENLISRKKMFEAIDEALKMKEKSREPKKEQSFSWESTISGEDSNEDEGFMDWLKKTGPKQNPRFRSLVPEAPIVGMINSLGLKKSDKHHPKDLSSNLERLDRKINNIKKLLSGNDSESGHAPDGIRVRRKTELDRSTNKIAKMFLTLSAINSKRKSKCKDEDYDDDYDEYDEDDKGATVKRTPLSTNEERYKVKKWIEHLKSRRSNRYCPCRGYNGAEEDVFPLEDKLAKAPMMHEDDSGSQESGEVDSRKDKGFFSRSGYYPRGRNGYNRNRYGKISNDIDEKLKALRNRGKKKLELPLDDLETYRSRAKKILQNAEDILDKIKEEEEKRSTKPEYLMARLKELTSRIHSNPRNNENNDFMRLIQKHFGLDALHKIQNEDDGTLADTIKTYFTDPYEKARELTEESAKQLSTFMLNNLAKLAENGENVKEEANGDEHKPNRGRAPQSEGRYVPNGLISGKSDSSEPQLEDPLQGDRTTQAAEGAKQKLMGQKDIDGRLKKVIDDMLKEQQEQLAQNPQEPPENYQDMDEMEVMPNYRKSLRDQVKGMKPSNVDSEKLEYTSPDANHQSIPALQNYNDQQLANLQKEIDQLWKKEQLLERGYDPETPDTEKLPAYNPPDRSFEAQIDDGRPGNRPQHQIYSDGDPRVSPRPLTQSSNDPLRPHKNAFPSGINTSKQDTMTSSPQLKGSTGPSQSMRDQDDKLQKGAQRNRQKPLTLVKGGAQPLSDSQDGESNDRRRGHDSFLTKYDEFEDLPENGDIKHDSDLDLNGPNGRDETHKMSKGSTVPSPKNRYQAVPDQTRENFPLRKGNPLGRGEDHQLNPPRGQQYGDEGNHEDGSSQPFRDGGSNDRRRGHASFLTKYDDFEDLPENPETTQNFDSDNPPNLHQNGPNQKDEREKMSKGIMVSPPTSRDQSVRPQMEGEQIQKSAPKLPKTSNIQKINQNPQVPRRTAGLNNDATSTQTVKGVTPSHLQNPSEPQNLWTAEPENMDPLQGDPDNVVQWLLKNKEKTHPVVADSKETSKGDQLAHMMSPILHNDDTGAKPFQKINAPTESALTPSYSSFNDDDRLQMTTKPENHFPRQNDDQVSMEERNIDRIMPQQSAIDLEKIDRRGIAKDERRTADGRLVDRQDDEMLQKASSMEEGQGRTNDNLQPQMKKAYNQPNQQDSTHENPTSEQYNEGTNRMVEKGKMIQVPDDDRNIEGRPTEENNGDSGEYEILRQPLDSALESADLTKDYTTEGKTYMGEEDSAGRAGYILHDSYEKNDKVSRLESREVEEDNLQSVHEGEENIREELKRRLDEDVGVGRGDDDEKTVPGEESVQGYLGENQYDDDGKKMNKQGSGPYSGQNSEEETYKRPESPTQNGESETTEENEPMPEIYNQRSEDAEQVAMIEKQKRRKSGLDDEKTQKIHSDWNEMENQVDDHHPLKNEGPRRMMDDGEETGATMNQGYDRSENSGEEREMAGMSRSQARERMKDAVDSTTTEGNAMEDDERVEMAGGEVDEREPGSTTYDTLEKTENTNDESDDYIRSAYNERQPTDRSNSNLEGLVRPHGEENVGKVMNGQEIVEKATDGREMVEKVMDSSEMGEEAMDNSEVREEAMDSSEVREKAMDNSEVREEAMDSSEVREKAMDSSEIVEKVMDSHEMIEKAMDSKGMVEKSMDSSEMVEKAMDSHEMIEKAMDGKGMVEKAMDSSEMVEKAMDSHEMIEKAMDSKGMVEKAMDSSEIVEKVMDSSEMVEKSMDSSEMVEKSMVASREDESFGQDALERDANMQKQMQYPEERDSINHQVEKGRLREMDEEPSDVAGEKPSDIEEQYIGNNQRPAVNYEDDRVAMTEKGYIMDNPNDNQQEMTAKTMNALDEMENEDGMSEQEEGTDPERVKMERIMDDLEKLPETQQNVTPDQEGNKGDEEAVQMSQHDKEHDLGDVSHTEQTITEEKQVQEDDRVAIPHGQMDDQRDRIEEGGVTTLGEVGDQQGESSNENVQQIMNTDNEAAETEPERYTERESDLNPTEDILQKVNEQGRMIEGPEESYLKEDGLTNGQSSTRDEKEVIAIRNDQNPHHEDRADNIDNTEDYDDRVQSSIHDPQNYAPYDERENDVHYDGDRENKMLENSDKTDDGYTEKTKGSAYDTVQEISSDRDGADLAEVEPVDADSEGEMIQKTQNLQPENVDEIHLLDSQLKDEMPEVIDSNENQILGEVLDDTHIEDRPSSRKGQFLTSSHESGIDSTPNDHSTGTGNASAENLEAFVGSSEDPEVVQNYKGRTNGAEEGKHDSSSEGQAPENEETDPKGENPIHDLINNEPSALEKPNSKDNELYDNAKVINWDSSKDWPLVKSQNDKELQQFEKAFEEIIKDYEHDKDPENGDVRSEIKTENPVKMESPQIGAHKHAESAMKGQQNEPEEIIGDSPPLRSRPQGDTHGGEEPRKGQQWARHPFEDDSIGYDDDPLMGTGKLPADYELLESTEEGEPTLQGISKALTTFDEERLQDVHHSPKPQKVKMPVAIEKIMKDLNAGHEKEDISSLQSLDAAKIDQFIDKIGEAENKNVEQNLGTDCMKECACADEIDSRSRKIGRYEIVKDFLHWVKDLQMNRVLSDD